METVITKKLSKELNEILEDYLFANINGEIVFFWRMKVKKEKELLNENTSQEDIIETCLEHNNCIVDSHCYISNKNPIPFLDEVKWNIENMNSFK